MNPEDNQLDRLFKAAARAPRAATGAAPFALENRVIGEWRAAASGDGGEWLVAWVRRATICACCLALASLAWNYSALGGGSGDELAVAESAMRIGVAP